MLLNWTLDASPRTIAAIRYYQIYITLVDIGQRSDIPQIKKTVWYDNADAKVLIIVTVAVEYEHSG